MQSITTDWSLAALVSITTDWGLAALYLSQLTGGRPSLLQAAAAGGLRFVVPIAAVTHALCDTGLPLRLPMPFQTRAAKQLATNLSPAFHCDFQCLCVEKASETTSAKHVSSITCCRTRVAEQHVATQRDMLSQVPEADQRAATTSGGGETAAAAAAGEDSNPSRCTPVLPAAAAVPPAAAAAPGVANRPAEECNGG